MAEIAFVDAEDHRIAYSWSHGPVGSPLVVLHGLGDSAIHTYAPRFARTSLANTPALFIDLPGFGESSAAASFPGTIEAMATAVRNLLTSLSVQNPKIFAHSMGANVAIAMVAAHADLRAPIILAEPLLNTDDSVLASTIVRFGEKQFVERGFAMLQRATSLMAKRGDMAAEAFLPVLTLAQPLAFHKAATSLLVHRDPSFIESLWSIDPSPVILIGERTRSDAIGSLEEKLTIIRIPEAGHNMMVEAEAATACAILDRVVGTDYQ